MEIMSYQEVNVSRQLIILLLSIFLLSACGGGGGGGNSQPAPSNPPPAGNDQPDPGFVDGTFEAFQNFEQLCENPRTGADEQGTPFPDAQGTTEDENNWLRSWSNELYLWYDEIVDVDPAGFSTPDYFEEMQTFDLTPSGAPKDKFHFIIPTDEWQSQSQGGVSGGYGATFAVLQGTPPRQVVVAYTEPGTPATDPAINFLRGASILEIDGADMINGNDIDTLNGGLFPGDNETHTFLIQDADGSDPRSITMTSTQITSFPVQNVSTIETSTGLVGYMTFNDHIVPAEAQLVDAVAQLGASNITDLVLDLRYNGGGFLDIANELAFMIAGPSAATGQVFESLQFNDKHPDFDPVTGQPLTPIEFHTTAQGFSVSSGTPLPNLGLSRVFILTGPGTCSASESVINGLRGVDVEVIQIGATSCGKPYGFYPFDNCGTTYFSIQFRGVNNKGFGDYADGFSPENVPQVEGIPIPGCFVSDDFTRQLGDPLEGRFRAALQFREDGTCPTIISSVASNRVATAQPLNAADAIPIKSAWSQNRIMFR